MSCKKESFELIRFLGAGGFAQTWLARVVDPDLVEEWGAEEVAIKIPLSDEKKRALRRDVELAGSLRLQLTKKETKNIVEYLGFEIFNGTLVMVMRYVKDGSLRNIIGKLGQWKRMDLGRALDISTGVLNGISVIHKKHMVHRDIKPDNILMDGPVPKIADFGISRMLQSGELASTTTGTLYYMSPELLNEESGASFNTDLWSFGITFYETVCGQFPFGIRVENMPPGKVMHLITDRDVKLTFPHDLAIPQDIKDVVAKALMKNPNERYKKAEEILNDLGESSRADDPVLDEIRNLQGILHDPTKADEAENRLKQLLRAFPDSSHAYFHFGKFYNRRGDYDRAIEMFLKGMEKDPCNAKLYWAIAIAYQQKGNYRSAILHMEKALESGLEPELQRKADAMLRMFRRSAAD